MHRRAAICLLSWFVLAGVAAAAEPRDDAAITVFHCTFGDDWDVNYDHWPDRWLRQFGPEYPHYVNIELADDAAVGRCLQIDLDGAAAAITSPPVRVMSRFRYVLEAKLKCEQLARSSVVVRLDFYDAAGHLLHSESSQPIATTDGWQQVRLSDVEPKDAAVDRAIVGLRVSRGVRAICAGGSRWGTCV